MLYLTFDEFVKQPIDTCFLVYYPGQNDYQGFYKKGELIFENNECVDFYYLDLADYLGFGNRNYVAWSEWNCKFCILEKEDIENLRKFTNIL